jgi:hypothetical protein
MIRRSHRKRPDLLAAKNSLRAMGSLKEIGLNPGTGKIKPDLLATSPAPCCAAALFPGHNRLRS